MYESATDLAGQIRSGQRTSVDVTREHVDRIRRLNPALDAVVIDLTDQALADAAVLDREAVEGRFRGPLHGVPMTVKEQFWVNGTKSTLNSRMTKDWVASEDGLLVKRLKDAGAVIMGKTNVPRDLVDYQVAGDLYPEGKNPYDPTRTPGGSSGGSAAALASGMTPIELGSDLGGSIRIPATFCGVYGLKPTEGTVPSHGSGPIPASMKGYVSHLGVAGPLARTPGDLELAWQILAGTDETDRTVPRIAWNDPSARTLADYRVAWVDSWPDAEPGDDTRAAIRGFVEALATHGAAVRQAAPEDDLHQRSLSLFVRFFPQIIGQGVPSFIMPLIKLSLRRGLLKGMTVFRRELDKGFRRGFDNYVETLAIRQRLVAEWERFFEEHDLLVCPVSFGPAFGRCKIGTPIPVDGKSLLYIDYAWPYVACFNASGHPAMNIPLGLGTDGLPVGVQVVGPYWSEPELLRFAHLVAVLTPGFVRPPTA